MAQHLRDSRSPSRPYGTAENHDLDTRHEDGFDIRLSGGLQPCFEKLPVKNERLWNIRKFIEAGRYLDAAIEVALLSECGKSIPESDRAAFQCIFQSEFESLEKDFCRRTLGFDAVLCGSKIYIYEEIVLILTRFIEMRSVTSYLSGLGLVLDFDEVRFHGEIMEVKMNNAKAYNQAKRAVRRMGVQGL